MLYADDCAHLHICDLTYVPHVQLAIGGITGPLVSRLSMQYELKTHSTLNQLVQRPPHRTPAEQLVTRDSGVQASRVPAAVIAREYMPKAYGSPTTPKAAHQPEQQVGS